METDIDTTSPLQYTPDLAPAAAPPESGMREESHAGDDRDYYSEQHYPQYVYEPPPASTAMAANEKKTFDLTSIDQSTIMVCFGAFLLGFIISKLTMQPIILKQ